MHLIKLFTAALFTTARCGSNLSIHQQRHRGRRGTYTCGVLARKKNETSPSVTMWMDLESVIHSQRVRERQIPCGSPISESEGHSVVSDSVTPWTIQTIEFFRLECWSG